MKKNKLPWGGRFQDPLHHDAFDFTKSIHIDYRLAKEDIEGSIAHITMLAKQNIIPPAEVKELIKDLEILSQNLSSTNFQNSPQEDIHMEIEHILTKKNKNAAKIHVARSRNDQVATDEKLFLKKSIDTIIQTIQKFQKELYLQSEKNIDVIMPGYTHLQRAQPILLSHHFLAYMEMFQRDIERFDDCKKRADFSPLGSAALAGTPINIDRKLSAKLLNFTNVQANSIDAVSDRDYIIEFISACSITMMHISRIAEEFVLWSSQEFNFIQISDAFTTGSSIMPQKKNPDIAELVRGKVGKVYGALFNILTIMKGLPLAYNRDMQEDKTPFFEAYDTTRSSLHIFSLMLSNTSFLKQNMLDATKDGFCTATDIADYLAERNVPFRLAHEITGKIVHYAISKDKTLEELSVAEYKTFSSLFEQDILSFLTPKFSIHRKKSEGSTSLKEVKKQLIKWKRRLL